MLPKKRKDIVEITSIELGLDPALVDSIITHYWKTLQKKLSSGEAASVNAENFGVFSVKRKAIEKKLLNAENYIKVLNERTNQSMTVFEIRKEKLIEQEKLRNLLLILEDEKNRKQETKIKREEYEKNNL